MRSLDYYYALSFAAIVLCAVVMTNRRFSVVGDAKMLNVLVVGCNLESAYLVSLLQKQKHLNVTLLEEAECSTDNSFTFVEGSPFSKRLVDSINFRYSKITDSNGFWNGERLQRMPQPFYRNIYRYGLSEYALRFALNKVKQQLLRLNRYSFDSV